MHLKSMNYLCTGTIRDNRLRKCPIESAQVMKKRERGSFSSATDIVNGIHICRWMDNSVVTMVSTAHGDLPISKTKRFSNKEKKVVEVDYPNVVKLYNQNMGGTDQLNQDTNRLRVGIRGKKWWWGIFTWLLDASITNAWNHSKSCGASMTQLEFRRYIASTYLEKYGEPPLRAGRISTKSRRYSSDLRKDRTDHFIVPCNRRRCAGEECMKHPATMCDKCDVGLCVACFKPYHA